MQIDLDEINALSAEAASNSNSNGNGDSKQFFNDSLLSPTSRSTFKPTRATQIYPNALRNINRAVCRYDEEEVRELYINTGV